MSFQWFFIRTSHLCLNKLIQEAPAMPSWKIVDLKGNTVDIIWEWKLYWAAKFYWVGKKLFVCPICVVTSSWDQSLLLGALVISLFQMAFQFSLRCITWLFVLVPFLHVTQELLGLLSSLAWSQQYHRRSWMTGSYQNFDWRFAENICTWWASGLS